MWLNRTFAMPAPYRCPGRGSSPRRPHRRQRAAASVDGRDGRCGAYLGAHRAPPRTLVGDLGRDEEPTVTTTLDPLEAHPELFLPEPEPRPVKYTIISVDDHLVEPPHMFEGRLPAALQDQAPRVIED